jgi:hypothetical protein
VQDPANEANVLQAGPPARDEAVGAAKEKPQAETRPGQGPDEEPTLTALPIKEQADEDNDEAAQRWDQAGKRRRGHGEGPQGARASQACRSPLTHGGWKGHKPCNRRMRGLFLPGFNPARSTNRKNNSAEPLCQIREDKPATPNHFFLPVSQNLLAFRWTGLILFTQPSTSRVRAGGAARSFRNFAAACLLRKGVLHDHDPFIAAHRYPRP